MAGKRLRNVAQNAWRERRYPGRRKLLPSAWEPGKRDSGGSGERDRSAIGMREAGQVRYWQYGQAEKSPDLAVSDPSRFLGTPDPRESHLEELAGPCWRRRSHPDWEREAGQREAGQVRYWQYGQAEKSPDLAVSDPSRFLGTPDPRESHLEELAGHVGDDEVTPPEVGEEHQVDRPVASAGDLGHPEPTVGHELALVGA